MADLGAFFGNPNIQRQGARARALASQRDVNTLPDPLTYAVMQGLLGTRPDEMGFSVLNPDYEKIKKVAEPAFALGLLGQAAPALAPLTKGLPVGASVKNVGTKLRVKPPTDDVYEVMDATFEYAKLGGNKTLPIDQLTGGVRMTDPKEVKRVKDLAEKISSPDGYVSRIIVDDLGNVLEGQHRLEALRLLGEKNVPVAVIQDLSNKYDIPAMKKALEGKFRSDKTRQLLKHSIDTLEEAGSIDKALSDFAMPARYQKPFEDAIKASKLKSSYPQEEALLLAQQRAALPKEQYGLGLPADNTPEMRAAAMNMEKRGFSETEGKNIEEGLLSFDTRRVGAAASDEQTPYAMFIKPSSQGIGIAKNQPAQMPLYVKSNQTDENILRSFGDRAELQQYLNQFPEIREATKAVRDLDNQMVSYMEELTKKADALDAQGKTAEADKILNSMSFDSPLMKEFDARTNELAAISKQKITELFNQQQVGTVGLRNDQGAFGRNTITEMVLNPNENVRSAFAAFDPFRRTAAIAAATGVAAPDLMAQEIDYSLIPAEKRRQILSLLE